MDRLERLKRIGNSGAIRKLANKFEDDEFDLGTDLDILLESEECDLEVIDDDRPISRLEFYTHRYSYSSDRGSSHSRSSVDTAIEKSQESDQLPDLIPIELSENTANGSYEHSTQDEVYYEASVVVRSNPNSDLEKDTCVLNSDFENISSGQKIIDNEIFEHIYIRNRTKNSNHEEFLKILLTHPIYTQEVGVMEQS